MSSVTDSRSYSLLSNIADGHAVRPPGILLCKARLASVQVAVELWKHQLKGKGHTTASVAKMDFQRADNSIDE